MPRLKPNGQRVNGTRSSAWIHRHVRYSIYVRDHWRCSYCNVSLKYVSPRQRTLDHYVPVAKGGTHDPRNVFTACLSCNSKRQHMSVPRFIRKLIETTLPPEGLYSARELETRIFQRIQNNRRRQWTRWLAHGVYWSKNFHTRTSLDPAPSHEPRAYDAIS